MPSSRHKGTTKAPTMKDFRGSIAWLSGSPPTYHDVGYPSPRKAGFQVLVNSPGRASNPQGSYKRFSTYFMCVVVLFQASWHNPSFSPCSARLLFAIEKPMASAPSRPLPLPVPQHPTSGVCLPNKRPREPPHSLAFRRAFSRVEPKPPEWQIASVPTATSPARQDSARFAKNHTMARSRTGP